MPHECQVIGLAAHLLTLGALCGSYGDLRGTDTLWSCASATADDAMARLAIVNLVHEVCRACTRLRMSLQGVVGGACSCVGVVLTLRCVQARGLDTFEASVQVSAWF